MLGVDKKQVETGFLEKQRDFRIETLPDRCAIDALAGFQLCLGVILLHA